MAYDLPGGQTFHKCYFKMGSFIYKKPAHHSKWKNPFSKRSCGYNLVSTETWVKQSIGAYVIFNDQNVFQIFSLLLVPCKRNTNAPPRLAKSRVVQSVKVMGIVLRFCKLCSGRMTERTCGYLFSSPPAITSLCLCPRWLQMLCINFHYSSHWLLLSSSRF